MGKTNRIKVDINVWGLFIVVMNQVFEFENIVRIVWFLAFKDKNAMLVLSLNLL